MKFFIDTADLQEIERAADYGVLDGVTTNPSLMAKIGVKGAANIRKHYKAICELVPNNVSAEVIATDFDGMIREAHDLVEIDDKIVVKVPMTKDGVKAISKLSDESIRTNCTLIFSIPQAILAAKAGASYVSPFIGRLDDIGSDGMQLIADLVQVFGTYQFATEILAASIRGSQHVAECARLGADVVTCPSSVIEQLFNHPLTDTGLEKFLQDHKAGQK